MRARWWRHYLLVGVLLAAGGLLLPPGTARNLVQLVGAASGVAAIVVGARANRPHNRSAWYLVAAGNLCWLSAHTLLGTDAPGPVSGWVVVPRVLAYVLLITGLAALVRGRTADRRPTTLLDTAIFTVGLGIVSWQFLIIPSWALEGATPLDRAVAVAFPLCDVLLVAIGIRLVTGVTTRNSSSRLLTGSLVLLLVTNGAWQRASGESALTVQSHVLWAGWLLGEVLWGAAALHPSMRALSTLPPEPEDTMLMGRLVMIASAVLVVPVLVVTGIVADFEVSTWPIVTGSVLLTGLVLTRMIRMVLQLKSQARRLASLAETDVVTGLANRRGFIGSVDRYFAERRGSSGEPDVPGALVLIVDLERFSDLTSTLGHDTGDALVKAVGLRLAELFGPAAIVARTGESTFGILRRATPEDPDRAPGAGFDPRAVLLRNALEQPFALADLSVSVEVSFGVVAIPDDAATSALALHRAGVALVGAKSRPGRIARYGPEMENGGTFAAQLVGELPGALERSEIVLHFQPQVEMSTGRVFGVEALARWQHPEHGLLAPDAFIPAAEQTGVIGPFTHYVLDRSLAQCARWRREGLVLTVAVNLSVRNLLDPELLEDVRSCLARHGLPAAALELEITEGTAMVDPNRSLQVLGALAGLGIALSIDDYGTGHSSLAYLQRLPVGRLKIDRSFVLALTCDDDSATIVRSTIELARHLRLDVIAEGVEDDATLLALRDMQCSAAQGYGLGRPVAADDLPGLVRRIEQRLPGVLGAAVLADKR